MSRKSSRTGAGDEDHGASWSDELAEARGTTMPQKVIAGS